MGCQIKQLLKSNDRIAAMKLLQQRKNLEKFVHGQYDRKYRLDEVLMNIEQGQQDSMVLESLKVANEVGKQQMQGQEGMDLESLMSEIHAQLG